MSVVRTYRLEDDVAGEYQHAVLGRIPFEFAAGDVTPRSEGDEIVLEEQLVPQGKATVIDSDSDTRELVTLDDRPAWEPGTPDVETPEAVDIPETTTPDPAGDDAPVATIPGSVAEILDEVGDDPELAATALALERDSHRPRRTLIERLERVIDADEPDDAGDDVPDEPEE